jgi:hypothetical protein
LLASLVFANTLLLLLGIVPSMPSYIRDVLNLCLDVLLPALIPAFYQHFKKRLITQN